MANGALSADTSSNGFLNNHSVQVRSNSNANPSYAAAVTLPSHVPYVRIGTLTGAITITQPSEGFVGQRMMLYLKQDGTGGRAVTFASGLKVPTAVPTTASSVSILEFVCDGASTWRQCAPTVTTT